MGWNKGYTIFEATVVGAYDLGKLDKELLAVLLKPYAYTDIDEGGRHGLKSKDGKEIEQIVVETWGLPMPVAPTCSYDEDPEAWELHREEVYAQMSKVTQHFNW